MVSQSYRWKNTDISYLSYTLLLVNPVNNKQFIDEFTTWLPDILTKHNKIIIAGDFNIHIDNTNSDEGTIFKDTMDAFGLIQHVRTLTHKDGHRLNLIMTEQGSNLQVENCFTGPLLSEHNMVECITTIPRENIHCKQINFCKLKNIVEPWWHNGIVLGSCVRGCGFKTDQSQN